MKDAEQIGVIAAVLIVVSILVGTEAITVIPDVRQVGIGISVGTVVAMFVWYITTNSERKNRKYTRTRIVKRYLDAISIAQGLSLIQQNHSEVDRLLKIMYECFDDIRKRAELQAHLLHAEEIDKFDNELSAVHFTFGKRILSTSGNLQLSRQLYDFLRNNLSTYIIRYGLKEFNEYVEN